MIEVRNLTKKYGNNTAVDNISFTVEPGKIYGFLGPNGAGKSTTMNIITGCLAPTDGEVFVNGHSMMDEPVEAKRAIGYLPETPPLYLDMTPAEYLRFVAEAKGVRRDKLAGEVADVMEATGVTEMASRLIRNLSKGYRQRVGIAQAMIGDPDIVILDEPTEGLDPQQRTEIRELINTLGRERTVILSSHVLSEVQEVCDNIIIISHGKLVANDTMDNIGRSLTPDTTMTVTVRATSAEVTDVLSAVEGVKYHEIVSDEDGEVSAKVVYPGELDLREAVSFAFSDIRRAVVSMGIEEENLEDIFLKLTADLHHDDDDNDAIDNTDDGDGDHDGVRGDNDGDLDDDDEELSYDPREYAIKDAAPADYEEDGDSDDSGDRGDDDDDVYKPLFGGK